MKLIDLIKPSDLAAACRKYDALSEKEGDPILLEHIRELAPLGYAVNRILGGMDFNICMTAITLVDLALREATEGRES